MSRLEELGEEGFLSELGSWLRYRNPKVKIGIGDDALVLSDGTVVSSDSYEQGVHFSLEYFSPQDTGAKSAAATLSDLAAMGSEPLCLLVNLFCPADLEVDYLKKIYQGIEEVSSKVGAEIAGGDTVSSDKLILSLTAVGKAEKPLLRSGARSGDLVYVSGFPGLSAVGHRVLSAKMDGFPESRAKHLRPEPRIGLGRALARRASACIDTSDGLSSDAWRLARMSKVKIVIEHENLPRHAELSLFAGQTGIDLDSLLLDGGEDYELLFTADASVDFSRTYDDLPLHRIGRVEEGEGVFMEHRGEFRPVIPGGYDHFK